MRDFSELVNGLKSDDVKSLMQSLCRSGKLVVSQFYTTDHIKELNNSFELEPYQIIELQRNWENDDKLHDDVLESFMYWLGQLDYNKAA